MDILQDITNRSEITRIREEQNAEYAESLKMDKQKEKIKQMNAQKKKQLETWRLSRWEEMHILGSSGKPATKGKPLDLKFQVPPSNITFHCSLTDRTKIKDMLCVVFKNFSEAMKENDVKNGKYDYYLKLFEARQFELASNYPSQVLTSVDLLNSTLADAGVRNRSTILLREIVTKNSKPSYYKKKQPQRTIIEDSEDSSEDIAVVIKKAPTRGTRIIFSSSEEESDSNEIQVNENSKESAEGDGFSSSSDMSADDSLAISGDLASVLGSLQQALSSDDESSESIEHRKDSMSTAMDDISAESEIMHNTSVCENNDAAEELIRDLGALSLNSAPPRSEQESAHWIGNEEERSSDSSHSAISFIVDSSDDSSSSSDSDDNDSPSTDALNNPRYKPAPQIQQWQQKPTHSAQAPTVTDETPVVPEHRSLSQRMPPIIAAAAAVSQKFQPPPKDQVIYLDSDSEEEPTEIKKAPLVPIQLEAPAWNQKLKKSAPQFKPVQAILNAAASQPAPQMAKQVLPQAAPLSAPLVTKQDLPVTYQATSKPIITAPAPAPMKAPVPVKAPVPAKAPSANSLEHEKEQFENVVVQSDGVIKGMRVKLLKHQVFGVNWMVSREQIPYPSLYGGGILADDMGLGKTIQTIATILSNPSPHPWKSTLIVCTLSTVSQWETEIREKVKSHNLKVCLYYGASRESDPYQLAAADVVLTTYGTLQSEFSRADVDALTLINPSKIPRNETEAFERSYASSTKKTKAKKTPCLFQIKWWRVVLDEAQYIKNRNTGKHKAAVRAEAFNRWCLTGTPIQNELKDLWSLLHFIRAPQCENLRYFNSLLSRLKCSNSKPAVEELHRLVEPLILRREKEKLKEDISSQFSDLPPCTIEKIYLDFRRDEQLFYQQLWEKAQDNFNRMLAKGTVLKNYMHIFEQILRLRQVCDHSYLLMKNSAELVQLNSPREGESPEEALMIINMQLTGYLESLRSDKLNVTKLLQAENAVTLAQPIVVSESLPENCSICCDGFSSPLRTACGHFFCNDCFTDWKQSCALSGQPIHCPMCRSALGDHEVRAVVVKERKRRQSIVTPKTMDDSNNNVSTPKSGKTFEFMDLPNHIICKIFGYVKSVDMSSIFSLNLTCKRFYATSRLVFGKLEYSSKIQAIVDRVKALQKTGKCVIFSQFTKFLEIVQYALVEEGVSLVRLDGSMRLSERKKVIDQFQKKENIRVFIVSLKAAACGLNLTAGRYVFMLDPWWNGAIEQQAIDRVHRFGQKNPVTVYRFVMRGSIEENLLLIQEKKLKISSLVLDEPCASKLTEDDLVTLFTNVRAMQDTSAIST